MPLISLGTLVTGLRVVDVLPWALSIILKLSPSSREQPQYGQMSVFIFSISSFSTRHSRTPSPRARCSVGAFPNAWPCVCAESPEEVVRLYLPQILGAARGAVSPPPLVDARHGHLAALLFE